MLSLLSKHSYLAALMAAVTMHGFASPADSKLLPLVLPGAEIVAGIEDPHNPNSNGRLLLVTRSNNLDYDDWVALTGVDDHREADEEIDVAASSPQGELQEHLLMVAGRFDRERIFRAAQYNGAVTAEYEGTKVLLVKPFPREQQEMVDARWMAILNNRVAIFGTPWLVQKALERYAAHAAPDPLLVRRLTQLRSDVNSWNVLVMSSSMLARHVAPGQLYAPWAHILDGADELTVGIHYGSRTRVDFVLHVVNGHQASYLSTVLNQPHLLQANWPQTLHPRLEKLSIDQDSVHGSIAVPGKQFDDWLAAVYFNRSR